MLRSLKLLVGEAVEMPAIKGFLEHHGYNRVKKVSGEGEYSIVGEAIVIFPVTFEYPLRLDVSGDKIHSIKSVDAVSMRAIDDHTGVVVLPVTALRRSALKRLPAVSEDMPISSFLDIEPGDMVVHIDYGIGRYLGLQRMKRTGAMKEYLVLEYSGGDRLYVERKDLEKVQRYVSFHRKGAGLSNLKGKKWESDKGRASKAARRVAEELLEIAAKRENSRAFAFSSDTDWQKEVEMAFPHKETSDQLKATVEVKSDMESQRPMDRLLCGDVGYGKTEVAMRAAVKAVMDNKQVAFLVPTTILAEQHTDTFTRRLKDFPLNIKMLNRFRTASEQKDILKSLRAGEVDIVIGTHRMLSDDVEFKDLGLLIVDEEHKFGVRHKEKIKKMRISVDVLTMTATPIPRTLYLALMGGRDMSVIETPPLERMPVSTMVVQYDEKIISEAIRKELARNGQVFYVHNRVETIDRVAAKVRQFAPSARLMVAHGQMNSKVLEKTMLEFIRSRADILVCTTIIESGIDIPNANTMIIEDADRFGLAELYQLRGRIGRFDREAYAYLTVRDLSSLTGEVQSRLNAIVKYQKLGSGFKIAMHDLEMRGAGNLLGVEQSGFIDQVGFDLYCRLLRNEIRKLRAEDDSA
jgi:transcription-repair coupling factor (superfamily II helicase)